MLKTFTGLRDYLSNSAEAIFYFKKYSPETVTPLKKKKKKDTITNRKNLLLAYSSGLVPQ